VQLPGGDLQIEWRKSDDHVYMTGKEGGREGGREGATGESGESEGKRKSRERRASHSQTMMLTHFLALT